MTNQNPNSQNTPNPGSIINPDKEIGKMIEMPAVDPDTARTIIGARPMPNIVTLPGAKPLLSLAAGAASNTVQGPASIAELARALKNDPQFMFEWV